MKVNKMAMKTYYYFYLVTFLVFSQVDGALVDGALQKPDICGETFLEQAQELSKGLPGITIKGPTTSEQILSCGKFAGKTLINGIQILLSYSTFNGGMADLVDLSGNNKIIWKVAWNMQQSVNFLPHLVGTGPESHSRFFAFFSQFLGAGGVKTYLENRNTPVKVTQKDIENCLEKFTSFFSETSHQVHLENWQTDFTPAPFKEAFEVTANLYEVLQRAGQQNSINEACQEDYGKLCQSLKLLAVQAYVVHDYQEAKNK
jgi:hypothetical protein